MVAMSLRGETVKNRRAGLFQALVPASLFFFACCMDLHSM